MAQYSFKDIAGIVGGKLFGQNAIVVSHLVTDSRAYSESQGALFFALKGLQHDGHTYITELYHRGIRGFVVSNLSDLPDACPEAGFIVVKDTLKALQQLAAKHRERFSCPVIGITGSNGKTITKEWLYHCLEGMKVITRSPKSYNSQIGVPLSLWLLEEGTELGIFEAGISMPGEMQKLQRMIQPDIGIITNIGEAHQENFVGKEDKINEKLKLFIHCKTLIFCRDHQQIKKCIEQDASLKGVTLFQWSTVTQADMQVTSMNKTRDHTDLSVLYDGKTSPFTIPFTDDASVENAIHTLAVLILLNVDVQLIRSKMATLPSVAMRLEQKSGINSCTIINDSYNSDINSLGIALDVLNRQVQHTKKTLILSDILQTGKKQNELYKTVARLVNEKKVTHLIGIGQAIKQNSNAFTINSEFFNSTEDFIREFIPEKFQNEAVLLKGSRQFGFERILALLEQKKHTTRVEVNLNALVHNLNYFRSLLRPGTRTMVMVKALSYGSGKHEIASVLQYQQVDYLGVAFADEGIGLRQAGITLPIIVMNPEDESFDAMIRHKLEPEIYSFRILEYFNQGVIRNQEVEFPVHIKIDSGMHRLGFLGAEIDELCVRLLKYRNLRVKSIFSHLAGSDDKIHDEYTRLQITHFEKAADSIIKKIGYPVIRHILNSSGIERFPEAQFEMVRLGIGLYGISCIDQGKLLNVSTLKSEISQLKHLHAGDTVGYGRKGVLNMASTIAVVPIGYADGLNRRLSNGKGFFLINGKKAPIIGNICMDMTMVDVTGITVNEGDEVIIFGQGNPITEVSNRLETIPYEVLTGISERVKRVYFHE